MLSVAFAFCCFCGRLTTNERRHLSMITRRSWRMREEGEMVAVVAECPECHNPASVVVSSDLLRPPLNRLPELSCSKCRKRFTAPREQIEVLAVNTRRC